MNGRLESDLKIYKQAEDMLDGLPRFVTNWYYYLKANNKAATTCRDYIRKTKHFLTYINGSVWKITPSDITDEDVIKYFAQIQTKKGKNNEIEESSDSYKQCVWSCLFNLFAYLKSTDEIQYNFIEKLNIKRPTNHDLDKINQHRVLLTEEDFHSILQSVDRGCGSAKARGYQKTMRNRDKAILLLFMMTGMRKGALASINIGDVDFDHQVINIVDKGKILHEYKLQDNMINTLENWMVDRTLILCGEKKDALFVSKTGDRISLNGIDKIVKKYSKEALGYSISPHKLRSGFISIIQSKSHDIEFTRRAVGHKNVITTQRYIVTDNKEREKAGQIMADLLF